MRRAVSMLLSLAALWSAAAAIADETTAPQQRVLGLTGAANFRDLGGYETADGHHVRWRAVYRSNKLSALTADDDQRLDALHIAAEIDLRTAQEREHEPSRWLHAPADLYESPKPSLGTDMKSVLATVHDGASARAALESFYARMPDLYRLEYAAFFQRLLAGEKPLVVHCTAGKDRTGVASAVLLSALGVPRPTVVADYTLTETLLPLPARGTTGIAMLDGLPEDARVELWRSEPGYITAALTAIDREYGSVDGYLVKGLGLTEPQIRQLRASMLQ